MDYDRASLTAKRLLAENGRNCTLQQITTGAYDVRTGSASQSVSSVTVSCADFPVRGEMNVNGTQIVTGDHYALISGADIASVSVDDRIVIDGVTWNIIAALTIAPGAVTVIHRVYVRK